MVGHRYRGLLQSGSPAIDRAGKRLQGDSKAIDDVEADLKDKKNRTPLFWAIAGGHEAVVQ